MSSLCILLVDKFNLVKAVLWLRLWSRETIRVGMLEALQMQASWMNEVAIIDAESTIMDLNDDVVLVGMK